MTSRYRLLFAQPGTRSLAAAGLLGRLPNGMLALAFVLAVVEATGSYPAAGAAAAAYTVAAGVFGPVWSRSADRVGPRRILLLTGLGQGVVLLLVAAATAAADSAVPLIALAGAGGVLLPPLAPVMRSLWSKTLPDADAKAAAFAYESIVVDVVFILGPSLVAAVTALAGASPAFVVAAVATTVGCLLVAANPRIRAVTTVAPTGKRHWLGPLRRPAVLGVLPIGLLLLGSIAVIEVSLVAFAERSGRPSLAGVLIAVLSVGGVAGGLYWGGRRQPGTTTQQLLVLLALLATGWALLAAPDTAWLLAITLAAAGLVLSPAITAMFTTMDEVAPPDGLTETFGWLNALGAAGSAAGAMAAGALVGSGAGGGFLLAAGMCGVGVLVAAAFQPSWRRARAELAQAAGAVAS